MKRGIPIRRSKAAAAARLVGALAVPVLAVAALGSRVGFVPGPALLPVIALGFALGVAALVISAYALIHIWHSGAYGAGSAITGVLYASPALVVLAAIVVAAFLYPPLTDVSTDPADPPAIDGRPETAPIGALDDLAEVQATAFPDIVPRFYPQPIGSVYEKARDLVEQNGWQVIRDKPPFSVPTRAAASAGKPAEAADAVLNAKATMTQSRAEATGAPAPVASPVRSGPDSANLQAVAPTLVFSFADDVVIEFREEPTGTRVDMRSASRIGKHDLGQNARRIRGFFAALDPLLQPDPNALPAPAPAAPGGAPAAAGAGAPDQSASAAPSNSASAPAAAAGSSPGQ